MNFKTRVDFTDRQTKQIEKTSIALSGASSFGVSYSALTSGVNLTMTGVTFSDGALQSTYSGNTGSTVYTFGDPRMVSAESDLVTLTPSNSGTTQFAGPIWSGHTPFVTVDGNSGFTEYSSVTYTLDVVTMIDLGGGAYSGVVQSDFTVYSGDSFDFTGRTIWIDVPEIIRANELILTKDPVIGEVLTCIDSEGRLGLSVVGSGSSFNVYNQNGALTGNRIVNLSGFNLYLTGGTTYFGTASTIFNGYVGIMEQSPSFELDVNGDATNGTYIRSNTIGNFAGGLLIQNSGNTWGSQVAIGGDYQIYDFTVAGSVSRLSIEKTTGNVGINTGGVAPLGKLEVKTRPFTSAPIPDDNITALYIDHGDTDNGNTAVVINNTTSGDTLVVNTDDFVVKSDGKVAFGHTTPTSKVYIQGEGSTSATTSLDVVDSGGTSNFFVKDNGIINMGNIPTSSAGLSSGDLWNNSGVLSIV